MAITFGPAWPFPINLASNKVSVSSLKGKVLSNLLRASFPEDNVKIVHAIAENGKGGATIAYTKCSDFNNSNMVKVAVAYCSKYDTFSKKIGTANALKKFAEGETIVVPARTRHSDHSIPENLRYMFWHCLHG